VIVVADLCKCFRVYARTRHWLREVVLGGVHHERRCVLRDVSFSVAEGETVAILGRNGAGKSTLLKLLMGVLVPDSGSLRVDGRITGLLELGTGFDPQLSGRENIYVNGLLLGMSRAEIAAKEAEIIAFSELEAFIDQPLRTYSSGMNMRLGFSVAIHASPHCFVVDEALSVGDAPFQQKCMAKIREFKQAGGAILFVSHDLNAVKMLADRAVVLEQGAVVYTGPTEDAVNAYLQTIADTDDALAGADVSGYGSGAVRLVSARALNEAGGMDVVRCGGFLRLEVVTEAAVSTKDVALGVMFRDRFGQDVFGTNSYLHGQCVDFRQGERRCFVFEVEVLLHPGAYTITLALHQGSTHSGSCFHWWDNALNIEVAGIDGPVFSGVCRLPVRQFTHYAL